MRSKTVPHISWYCWSLAGVGEGEQWSVQFSRKLLSPGAPIPSNSPLSFSPLPASVLAALEPGILLQWSRCQISLHLLRALSSVTSVKLSLVLASQTERTFFLRAWNYLLDTCSHITWQTWLLIHLLVAKANCDFWGQRSCLISLGLRSSWCIEMVKKYLLDGSAKMDSDFSEKNEASCSPL